MASTYEALPVDVDGAADVVAFARRIGGGGAIVAVPRMVESLMAPSRDGAADQWPIGDVWRATRVRLPADLEGVALSNIFTGERLSPETLGGVVGITASRLFSDVPVAILTWGVE
jgi:maltooligosyltrehalose synthase